MVYKLCDQSNAGFVTRDDLVQLAKLAEELLKRYNFGFGNVATPEESVYDIFGIKGEPKARDSLRKKEFLAKAELDPDMYLFFFSSFHPSSLFLPLLFSFPIWSLRLCSYRCFGLFDYFYCMLIKPIEEQV